MKRNLNEQLERIHNLNNSSKSKLLSEQKQLVNVESIINALDDFTKYGIKITKGYSNVVKKLQQALQLLGYDLPKYGADGYFGNETKSALLKLVSDVKSGMLNESASELRSTLNSLGYDEKGNEIDNGGPIRNEISNIASQILRDYKQIKPDVHVVVTGGNDKYHHQMNYTSKHTLGLALDFDIEPYNTENAQAFIDVVRKYKSKYPSLSFSNEYTNPSARSTGGHFHIQLNLKPIQRKETITIGPNLISKIIELVKQKELKKLQKRTDNTKNNTTEKTNIITKLDLSTEEGVQKYSEIAEAFIKKRGENPLGITGDMIARGAKQAYEKYGAYVPPEISLSQLAIEGGVGNPDPNIRPVRTKNPYNIGNTDKGRNRSFNNVQTAINLYFNVIAKHYLSDKENPTELFNNFVNTLGQRYASSEGYENLLGRVAKSVRRLSQQVV